MYVYIYIYIYIYYFFIYSFIYLFIVIQEDRDAQGLWGEGAFCQGQKASNINTYIYIERERDG